MKALANISQREKRVLVIGAAVIALIIIYRLVVWYGDINTGVTDLVEAKQMMLEKQINNIAGLEALQKRVNSMRLNSSRQEKALLAGDKPPVAAAELQSILKELITSQDIEMRSERTLTPVEVGHYLSVPVEIGFITDTGKLKSFLYKLTRSRLLLKVSELKVRVTNLTNPENTYVTVVVTGFIKKPSNTGTDKRGR